MIATSVGVKVVVACFEPLAAFFNGASCGCLVEPHLADRLPAADAFGPAFWIFATSFSLFLPDDSLTPIFRVL